MALYGVKYRIAAPAANAFIAEIRPAANRPAKLRRLLLVAESALAAGGAFGVYRTTNVPAGGTNQQGAPLKHGEGNATPATGCVSTGQTTAPTVGTVPLDGGFLGAVIGSAAILVWGYGEELVAGPDPAAAAGVQRSIVIRADTALPALSISAIWDE